MKVEKIKSKFDKKSSDNCKNKQTIKISKSSQKLNFNQPTKNNKSKYNNELESSKN